MAALPSSPLFRYTLRRFRHGDSAEWHRLLHQLEALELVQPFEAWRSQLLRQLPRDPSITRFTTWMERAVAWVPNCKEIVDLDDAFLRDELRAFIARRDANAQAREALLDSLQDQYGQKIPPKTRGRIYELCFLPPILFEWCESTILWSQKAHDTAEKERKRLHSLTQRIQANPLVSKTEKDRWQQLRTTMRAFLKLNYPGLDAVKIWRKQLGIDKPLPLVVHRQRLWSCIFFDLVNELRPFCIHGSRKHEYLEEMPTKDNPRLPERVYRVASRLMHLACPDLAPDNPKWVRDCYHNAKSHTYKA